MIQSILDSCGLSSSEKKVYLFLLKGKNYPSAISRSTSVNRTLVYEACDRLCQKGLVSFITDNGKLLYSANDPQCLIELLERKKQEINTLKKEAVDAIEKLQAPLDKETVDAGVYTGKLSIRNIHMDMIRKKNSTIHCLLSRFQFFKIFPQFLTIWHAKRVERNVFEKVIVPKRHRSQIPDQPLYQAKFVSDAYERPTFTGIYEDKICFIHWDSLRAVVIQNKDIAASQLHYFSLLWKQAEE